MPYLGREGQFGVRERFQYLASNGDTSVSGANANGIAMTFSDGLYIDVYLNGVKLKAGEDYNTNTANTVAGISAMNANDEIEVIAYDAFTVADTVSAADGGTFSGNVTMSGTSQINFNDASQNITAPSATVLDINATDEVEINATLADVNANLDVSGTYTGGGLMTTGGNIVIPDSGNIGSASDTDAMSIASTGQVTFSQNINPPHPTRNYLINGDFAVSQRLAGAVATSATTPANSDDTVIIDRWILLSDGNDIIDVGRAVANRTDMRYIGYNVVETADKKFGFAQIIEAQDAAQLIGGSAVVTLSFVAAVSNTTRLDDIRAGIASWSSTADSVTSDLVSAWNGADTNPTLATNWTFENVPANLSVGTSFARYSVTATIDTSSTANVAAFIWSNSVDNDVDDVLYLGGCQLELGSYATPFITETYEENLARCQRYFRIQDVNDASGSQTNSLYYYHLQLSPSMRDDPTIAASHAYDLLSGNFETRVTSTWGTGVSLIDSSPNSLVFRGNTTSAYNWVRGSLHLESEL